MNIQKAAIQAAVLVGTTGAALFAISSASNHNIPVVSDLARFITRGV